MIGNVVLPNAKGHLADEGRTVYKSAVTGNFQQDGRDAVQVIPLLQGRGRPEADLPDLYRIRINLFKDGTVPKAGDTFFVTWHKHNPNMRGWYTLWTDPSHDTGSLATMILWLHKENLQG
jgi:hypothetical protein